MQKKEEHLYMNNNIKMMIAHRGGYDFNAYGENSINNIIHTICHYPDFDIEIDIRWEQNEFIVSHDELDERNQERTRLEDVLKILCEMKFKNLIFLDVKKCPNILYLQDVMIRYLLRYCVHSFVETIVKEWTRHKTQGMLHEVRIGYAFEDMDKIKEEEIDYFVIPKEHIERYRKVNKPIYWYSFETVKEYNMFMKGITGRKKDMGFIDYLKNDEITN